MSLIISKNGKDAQRLNQTSFDKEDYLQQYIYDNPDAVPVYEIDEDIRLLILAREFGTASGPIDALGVDQHGDIYLIETKLYKNADKRTVVAQVLDYGASLWRSSIDFNDFTLQLDKHVAKQFGPNTTLIEKLQEFFDLDSEGTGTLLDSMKANLASGTFRFVVLMDSLERRLKDLILFMNRNSQFDVYAVELEYYKYQDYELIIPRLYGGEVKKEVTGTRTSAQAITIDEFWSALSDSLPENQSGTIRRLIEALMPKASNVKMNTKSISLIFDKASDRPLVTFYPNGYMSLSFGHLTSDADKQRLQKLVKEMLPTVWKLPKFQSEKLLDSFPGIPTDELATNAEQIQKLLEEFII